jgi:AraC family transcriptional regulator of adaptative response/methylated-DNA-[protein]-cysteine methyltransferase
MTANLTLAPATLSDVPALCALLSQLFAQEQEFTPDLSAQQAGLQLILQQPDTGCILVARQHGEVIAMVSLLFTISTALGGRVALLEDMVVDQRFRGQHIGSQLLAYAIEHARAQQVRRITLLTDHDNHSAQHFYRQHGFQPSSMQAWRLLL